MVWWAWVAIWACLIAAAIMLFVVIGVSVRRQVREVSRELEIASERFALLNQQLEQIQAAREAAAQASTPQPAPFDDVSRLRREHTKAVRRAKAMTAMRIQARRDQRAV